MLNTPQGEGKDVLTGCCIELAQEPIYAPGDLLIGKVHVKISRGFLNVNSLRVSLKGVANVAIKGKKEENCYESCVYLKKDWNLIETKTTIVDLESSYVFQECLPPCLPSSVQSPKGSVLYFLTAILDYLNEENEVCIVKAVRGITVVELVDMNLAPRILLESRSESEQKKFGWFTCTGGNMRLFLTLERTAFVCGEGFSINGRIENKSDKNIEKITLGLQRVLHMGTDLSDTAQPVFTDMQEIQEDLLAMYVVPGATIRIDKKITIPPCPPSSQNSPYIKSGSRTSQDILIFPKRRRSQLLRTQSSLSLKSPNTFRRIINISYTYLVKVKAAGVDVIEITIPVLVASRPLKDPSADMESCFDMETFPGAIFKSCKPEKLAPLLDEQVRTLCNKAQLQHINKYPFYASLPTSSKQSKKLSAIAGALRSEAKIVNVFIKEHAGHHRSDVKQLSVDTL